MKELTLKEKNAILTQVLSSAKKSYIKQSEKKAIKEEVHPDNMLEQELDNLF